MPRHDRANGTHHAKRAKGGNKRRVPSHEKARNKRYVEPKPAPGRAKRRSA